MSELDVAEVVKVKNKFRLTIQFPRTPSLLCSRDCAEHAILPTVNRKPVWTSLSVNEAACRSIGPFRVILPERKTNNHYYPSSPVCIGKPERFVPVTTSPISRVYAIARMCFSGLRQYPDHAGRCRPSPGKIENRESRPCDRPFATSRQSAPNAEFHAARYV